MKKLYVIFFAACMMFVATTTAFADGAPWPKIDNTGTFLQDETFAAGRMYPNENVYLLSETYGWKPNEQNMMTKVDGGFKSKLIPAKGTKYHPAQIINGKMEYLKIEYAHPGWQLDKTNIAEDSITYRAP